MMLKTLTIAGAAALLSAGFGATGAQAQDCTIPLGAVFPLTGPNGSIGEPIAEVGRWAVEQFNEAGGVHGCEVEYLLRDTQGQPAVGVDAARNLVDVQGVPALLGAISSGVSLPILTSVTAPSQVTHVSCCSSSPSFTELARSGESGGYFFRTLPTSRAQGVVMGRLARDQGYENVSVIYLNTDYGVNLAAEFEDAFESWGGNVLESVAYNQEQASYRPEVNTALAVEPEALILIAFPVDGATILREWVSFGGPQEYVLSNALRSDDVLSAVGAQYLEGALGVDNAQVTGPSVEQFNADYQAAFNEDPNRPGIHINYDAAAVTLLAMQASEEVTGTSIRDNIRAVTDPSGTEVYPGVEGFRQAIELLEAGETIRYVGATGPLSFDENGDVAGPVLVWTVADGALAEDHVVTIDEVNELFAELAAMQ
ncbi:MAG: ABC transporter substrate-binding protein [Phycisphaerales bacterium]